MFAEIIDSLLEKLSRLVEGVERTGIWLFLWLKDGELV